ncbi:hypothetical protein J4436_00405 [Candidatus Woesearchaeota archaeon]|nr:hypothetical protein [Candidatus Woesearchaeota archaeon]
MKFKKYFPTLLSILTVILIPYFLYKIRNLLKFTIESLSNYSPRLLDLQNSLTTNITLQETLNIQNELSSIHFATQKALAINYFLLPIGIFLIWILTEGFSWKIKNKVKLSTFTLYSLPLFILLYLFILQLLELISAVFFYTEFNIIYLLISGLFLLVYSYIAFISLSVKKNFMQNLRAAKDNIRLFPEFFLFIITTVLVLISMIIIYIFLSADYSIIIPFIVLIILTLLLIWQKNRLIKKILFF